MAAPDTICITCSHSIGDPPRLNHLSNGKVCATCRDRLLDSLPPAMPHPPWERVGEEPIEAEGERELAELERSDWETDEPERA